MAEVEQSSQYYMKGRSRHLFWPMVAISIIQYLLRIFIILPMLLHVTMGVLLIQLLFSYFAIALQILYGLNVRVKAYRVIFFVMAALSYIDFINGNLSYIGLSLFPIHFSGDTNNGFWTMTVSAMEYISSACLLACYLVIAFHRKTNGVLRIAALVLILDVLLGLAVVISQILMSPDSEEWIKIYSSVAIYLLVFDVFCIAFFTAAMCFSKMKLPKTEALTGEALPSV